ncbi:hypothetical protein AVEN_186086-2-1, partial [Araneus ventricosus]
SLFIYYLNTPLSELGTKSFDDREHFSSVTTHWRQPPCKMGLLLVSDTYRVIRIAVEMKEVQRTVYPCLLIVEGSRQLSGENFTQCYNINVGN